MDWKRRFVSTTQSLCLSPTRAQTTVARAHRVFDRRGARPWRSQDLAKPILSLDHGRDAQRRSMSSTASLLPEFVSNFSIWGGSGYLLETIHATTGLPYWACFATLSVSVRTLLVPVVLHGAHTASRFAQIAPDVQFQIALFQKDVASYRAHGATLRQVAFLLRTNMATLSATYRLHKVNPLMVLASPLLQIPIFWYVSVDMRKIVNGLDPQLAQRLVECPVGWIPDLTEADPYYGLPIMAGLLLYANMEVSLGRRALAGPATSKADTAILLKDIFQSVAVFMPCFTAHMPAGIQIYVVTTFAFTMLQSAALRTEGIRALVGLPSMQARSDTDAGRFTRQMMELKQLEEKAKALRGDGPLLGQGVLMHGWQVSFAGQPRASTIVSTNSLDHSGSHATLSAPPVPFRIQPWASPTRTSPSTLVPNVTGIPAVPLTPFIHGISAHPWQLPPVPEAPVIEAATTSTNESERESVPHFDDDVMEKANRGESPRPIQFIPDTNSTRTKPSGPVVIRKAKASGKRRRK